MRRTLRKFRNLLYQSILRLLWKDHTFRFFVIEAVKNSGDCDLRFARGQMTAMSVDEQDFFKFVMNHSAESRSQGAQDLWALYESKEPGIKFFVDFGATDGVKINNTVLLEREYGWKGIVAEPNPVWHDELEKNRTAIVEKRCVHSVTGSALEFLNANNPEYGGIANGHTQNAARKFSIQGDVIKVETVSLGDLLEKHHAPARIDFMSVDTEGSEYDILESFDFKKWDVRLFSIELGPIEKDNALNRLMAENGYTRRFEKFSGGDAWFKKIG